AAPARAVPGQRLTAADAAAARRAHGLGHAGDHRPDHVLVDADRHRRGEPAQDQAALGRAVLRGIELHFEIGVGARRLSRRIDARGRELPDRDRSGEDRSAHRASPRLPLHPGDRRDVHFGHVPDVALQNQPRGASGESAQAGRIGRAGAGARDGRGRADRRTYRSGARQMNAPLTTAALDPEIRRELGSLKTKLFYGFGSVSFGVKDNGFQYFLLFFYSQVLGVSALSVGEAIFIALVVDAFADPIVGQFSDNLRTRLGRRHPLMYAAAIPSAIAYYFLWNPPALSANGMFLYLVFSAIIVRTFITMYEIPSSALVAELTPDYDQRTSFLGYRYFFGWMGGLAMQLLAFGVFFAATKAHPVGPLNPAGYFKYSVTAAIIMAVAIFISARGTQKFVPYFSVPPERKLSLSAVLKEMFETVWHRSFIVLTVSAIFSAVAAGTLTALNTHFNTFFWGLSAGQIFWVS